MTCEIELLVWEIARIKYRVGEFLWKTTKQK